MRTDRTGATSKARTNGKAPRGAKTKDTGPVIRDGMSARLGEHPHRWHDGFIVHEPGLLDEAIDYLDWLSQKQLDSAVELLDRGFVLGVVANETEAPGVAAECGMRFFHRNTPIAVHYDADDAVLYIRAIKG